jgi:hypothetical protein
MAVTAIELGIWTALRLSPHPTGNARSLAHRVAPASPRGMKRISNGTQIPSHYALISVSENDGESFAIPSDRTEAQPVDTVSGGGSADVFDQQGHLTRHYTLIEHGDHAWEITELIRLNHEPMNENRTGE